MNQRNVEALTLALFQEQAQKPNDHVTFDDLRGTGFVILAQRLASRGVLVPSALTDDECYTAQDTNENQWEMISRYPNDFRKTLEDIAKGGP